MFFFGGGGLKRPWNSGKKTQKDRRKEKEERKRTEGDKVTEREKN